MRAFVWTAIALTGCVGAIGDETEGEPAPPAAMSPSEPTGGGGSGGPSIDVAPEGGAPAEESPCPRDTVQVGDVCIDRFEAPNLAGAPPLAMQTAFDGETWCAERDKRLCTDVEWIAACEGSAGHLYPYGDDHVAHRCNDDKTWLPVDWAALGTWPSEDAQAEAQHLYQADPSGARRGCGSEAGAHDLTGNVAEWVVRTLPGGQYDHVMKGCYWAGCYGGTLPNCTFVNPAHPGGFRSYEAGFRCCRDAEL